MQGSDLIVQIRESEHIYELLPMHALDGDFPQAFIQDYAYWLDIDTGFVDLRSLLNA